MPEVVVNSLQLMSAGILARAAMALFTLYMMCILLRWFGNRLDLDVYAGRLRWVSRITDPFLRLLRHRLPSFGPVDLSPVIALLLVWLTREAVVSVLLHYRL